jgi:ribosome-associated translation inhibitor RaiA
MVTRRPRCTQPIIAASDQARTDFAAIESDLEVIQKQLSRLPTRRELARTALGIIFAR